MPLALFPDHIRTQYNLDKHAVNGFVYLELRGAIYGLPQAGALANKLLRKRLAPHRYYEVAHTPGLMWAESMQNTSSTCYKSSTRCPLTGTEDSTVASNSTGITIFADKVLQRFQHPVPSSPQNGPYKPYPKKYGAAAQDPIPMDASAPLDSNGQKRTQQIVGALLYYVHTVNNTILLSLSAIASEQAHPTQLIQKRCQQLLDYCASHPDAVVRFKASDMVLNIHSDASYLSESNARSRFAGHFFLGSVPIDKTPIELNGAIYVFCGILKFVVASAAEAELGALFLNCKEGKILRLVLQELGHYQPPTPTHCDNETATGIANNTVKKQWSRSMEIRHFQVRWQPGQENLADYFTKHFEAWHHISVRPWYLHTKDSPQFLPRAATPSSLRGCVGTLPNGYMRTSPLPRIPLTGLGRVPLDRQHMGLPHIQPTTAAPFCVRAAILSH
eukprot:CCRYP_003061-RA/>CCRYP_003061-RA protein AED:0.38 eAED:0.32 QI:0/0/0/1/0/0/3/0/444